jgi:hypothetical protein
MPANTSPIFSLTPHVSSVTITQTSANVKSSGAGTIGTDIFLAFQAGTQGSFIQKVRFNTVAAAAAVTGVATTLRVFWSTVGSSTTAATNTFLLGEVSVPAIASAHSTNATSYYDLILNFPIQSGTYIHVSQHVAQTANQNWIATVFGGDY